VGILTNIGTKLQNSTKESKGINFTGILHFVFWLLFFGASTFIATQTLPIGYAVKRNLLVVFFNALVFYINFLWIMPEFF